MESLFRDAGGGAGAVPQGPPSGPLFHLPRLRKPAVAVLNVVGEAWGRLYRQSHALLTFFILQDTLITWSKEFRAP